MRRPHLTRRTEDPVRPPILPAPRGCPGRRARGVAGRVPWGPGGLPAAASTAARTGTSTPTVARSAHGMTRMLCPSSEVLVRGSHPCAVSGRAMATPGTSPTATPRTQPTAARTKAWAAAMTRRVPRVAPSAARVAWSVCCSARVSAVEVRTTTRMRTAKTPRRIATKSRSSRWKPSSRCTPTSSPSRSDIRSRTASETAAPSGSRTVHESTRVGQSFVSGVPAAKARLPPSRRPAESLVSGRCTAGTAVSEVTATSGGTGTSAAGSTR